MNVKCDWCSSIVEEPIATIHCKPFVIEADRYVDDGEWATCNDCAELFHKDGIPALTEKALAIHVGNPSFIRRMHAEVERGFINIDYEHP